ncbi:hypothetical protein M758_8G116700 [Ceratodon purpureus]|nr:hypothetical protein M758_8G116700 [Ceratodon purpureus]
MATVRIHGVLGAADSTEDKSEGSIWWFREKVGLNGHGFIPGTDLRDEQCSRSDYVAFWGPKNYHHGTRYKKKVSPRMVRRIRRLYQHVFQRPIGAANEIPYHFGKGLLAERKGYPIDWAAYARKMTHRGTGDMAHVGKAAVGRGGLMRNGLPFEFVSMEALRMKTPLGQWRKNEVDSASDSDEGSPNDWQVNVQTNSVMKPGGRRCQVARQTSPAHSLRKSPSTSRLEGKDAGNRGLQTSREGKDHTSEDRKDVNISGRGENHANEKETEVNTPDDSPTCKCGRKLIPLRFDSCKVGDKRGALTRTMLGVTVKDECPDLDIKATIPLSPVLAASGAGDVPTHVPCLGRE